MFKIALACTSAALIAAASALPAVAESATIRIEPRPYYGAIVTIEKGVRVWRPLPTTKYVVINPNGSTPLNLNLTDVNEKRTSHNYFYGSGQSAPYTSGQSNTYAVPFAGHNNRGNGRGGRKGAHRSRGGGLGHPSR